MMADGLEDAPGAASMLARSGRWPRGRAEVCDNSGAVVIHLRCFQAVGFDFGRWRRFPLCEALVVGLPCPDGRATDLPCRWRGVRLLR